LKLVEIAKGHEMPTFELRDKNGTLMNAPEIDFRLEDFVTVKDGSAVGAGMMSWQKGGFSWTLTYDEVDYVVEGIMEITYEGRTIRANKGDLVFIPAGSAIRWSTPSWVLVYYVTFPAEWAAQ
jgi:ethanolamine utilization protein EutQ